MSAFARIVKEQAKNMELYVPVVARVHGGSHPEFHQVRAVYDEIVGKIKKAAGGRPDLAEDFARLRKITTDYTVPADTCETYEAVYRMLAQWDRAYSEDE